ncbi:hypothetical protein [Pantoea ananatis]|uniref:hypothetical protein n=1 Tax=Pantoea ananas TaxID=553 RepID=UPI000CF4838F|nr:hypothetical protein [Pantoea ananatis]PQK95211.1 hypothetical protein CG435_22290 [Pantoea ananatis]PWK05842.1 hypothetical protein C7421_112123 [Pantoea ananatis]
MSQLIPSCPGLVFIFIEVCENLQARQVLTRKAGGNECSQPGPDFTDFNQAILAAVICRHKLQFIHKGINVYLSLSQSQVQSSLTDDVTLSLIVWW